MAEQTRRIPGTLLARLKNQILLLFEPFDLIKFRLTTRFRVTRPRRYSPTELWDLYQASGNSPGPYYHPDWVRLRKHILFPFCPVLAMDPTLSSWLKNMNKLSSLIDRLEELASSAPEEHRSQISRTVATLRTTFKKQQERCIEFLQLSEEYADKYLLDFSAEIRQQSSFLDMLEKRLDMAKTLRQQAVDLRRSYESGTVATMKDLRATGKIPCCCLQR